MLVMAYNVVRTIRGSKSVNAVIPAIEAMPLAAAA